MTSLVWLGAVSAIVMGHPSPHNFRRLVSQLHECLPAAATARSSSLRVGDERHGILCLRLFNAKRSHASAQRTRRIGPGSISDSLSLPRAVYAVTKRDTRVDILRRRTGHARDLDSETPLSSIRIA